MTIIRDILLVATGYEVLVDLVPGKGLTSQEQEVFERHGGVVVELGGRFYDKKSGLVFDLPEHSANLPEEFPVFEHFALKGNPVANDMAILYLDTVVQRLKDAKNQALTAHPVAALDDVFQI